MIARCGVSIWLVPALAWIGVCYADPSSMDNGRYIPYSSLYLVD